MIKRGLLGGRDWTEIYHLSHNFFRTSRIEVMVEPDLKEVERKLIAFVFLAQRDRDIESFYLFVLPNFKTKKINSNEGLQPKKDEFSKMFFLKFYYNVHKNWTASS